MFPFLTLSATLFLLEAGIRIAITVVLEIAESWSAVVLLAGGISSWVSGVNPTAGWNLVLLGFYN